MENATGSVSTNSEKAFESAAKKPVAKRTAAQKPIREIPKTFANEIIEPTAVVVSEPEMAVCETKERKSKKTPKRRTLCKLVKKDYLEKHFSEYMELVADSVWICKKCGRTANDSRLLCKPRHLSKRTAEDITPT